MIRPVALALCLLSATALAGPADPWRVVELGLVAAEDGRSLWSVRREEGGRIYRS